MASRLQSLERAAVILGALCGMVALAWQISDSVRSRTERISVEVEDFASSVDVRVTNLGDHAVYIIGVAANYDRDTDTQMYVYNDSLPPLPLERNATHRFRGEKHSRAYSSTGSLYVYMKTSRSSYIWNEGILTKVPLLE